MKKFALFQVLLLSAGIRLFSAIQVQLSYATFYNHSSGPYVEFYLSFVTDNLKIISSPEGFYSELDVNYAIDNSSGTIEIKNFVVVSPAVADSGFNPPPFVSLHRIFLEKGEYDITIRIRDMNGSDLPVVTNEKVSINFDSINVAMSDIEMYQSAEASTNQTIFHKHGFEIIPYPYEIVPQAMKHMGFYAELYNIDQRIGEGNDFLITYYLESYEDGSIIEGYKGFSRKKAEKMNIVMGKFLLEKLSTGNYYIRIDVLNKENELILSKKLAFHKENPVFIPADSYANSFVDRYTSADSLSTHIQYLEPIADRLEWEFAKNQLSVKDFDLMKKYFLNFWLQRNVNEPETAWKNYLNEVKITLKNFSTPMLAGYLTDRGFRYLKYGKPDDRYESFDEPRAFPHEIWYYNKVALQSNRMIVFCNKNLVLNDYQIIHSDINGELYNKDWNVELHRYTPGVIDNENPLMEDHFGNKSRDWTNLPR